MLRTNLASRPFYNDRIVRLGIALGVVVVTSFTAFNALQVLALNAQNAEMSIRAQEAERQTEEFRQQAQQIRQSLNTAEMAAVQQASREANLLIDRRVFSWTELFNEFERTLPAEVRITAVEPQVDPEGRMLVAVTVLSRQPEDLSQFMDQLETSGRFREVLNRQDQPQDDGLMRSVIQGYYDPHGALAVAEPQSSDSPGPGNTPGDAPAPKSEPPREEK
jgi:hypothetical protein